MSRRKFKIRAEIDIEMALNTGVDLDDALHDLSIAARINDGDGVVTYVEEKDHYSVLFDAEIQKTLVLSTQHIPNDEYLELKKLSENESGIECQSYNTVRILVLSPDESIFSKVPTVLDFVNNAHYMGCTWLVFDPDSSPVKGLKTFE